MAPIKCLPCEIKAITCNGLLIVTYEEEVIQKWQMLIFQIYAFLSLQDTDDHHLNYYSRILSFFIA